MMLIMIMNDNDVNNVDSDDNDDNNDSNDNDGKNDNNDRPLPHHPCGTITYIIQRLGVLNMKYLKDRIKFRICLLENILSKLINHVDQNSFTSLVL